MKLLLVLIMIAATSVYASYIDKRFDNIERQQSDTTCGIASLSVIMNKFYNINKTEFELFKHLTIKPEYSFNDLSIIAKAYNLGTLGIKLSITQLSNIRKPAILHLNRLGVSHFVVLNKVTSGYVQVSDPAWGNLNYTHAQFKKYWIKDDGLGRALIFLTPIKNTIEQPEIYKKIINADANNL